MVTKENKVMGCNGQKSHLQNSIKTKKKLFTSDKGWSGNKWVKEYYFKGFKFWPPTNKKLQKEAVQTETYFTFEEYVKEYKCSYYTVPTNYDKAKLFNGEFVNVKEGCGIFDEIIKTVINNPDIQGYIKFQ